MANKISITKLESDVIGNGFGKSNFNTEGNPVWSNSLIEGCKLCTIKQLPGVISSLVKKGLALAEGEGSEKTVALTDEGKVILKRLVSVDSAEPIVEPVVAEENKDNTEAENKVEPVNIPDEPFKTFAELVVACNTIPEAYTLINEIRSMKVVTPKEEKPKRARNMDMARKVLTEANGKISIDDAVKRLLEIHTLRTENPIPQAKKIFLLANKYGVPSTITKENGVKYIELA
jgi:predicted transcriptional regulator